MKEAFEEIVSKLKKYDFIICYYNAITTDSIYIKLDYGVANSIRISDHKGIKKYDYKYNVVIGLNKFYTKKGNKFEKRFYTVNDIDKLIKDIVDDKCDKLKKYGLDNYIHYMDRERNSDVNRRFKNINKLMDINSPFLN